MIQKTDWNIDDFVRDMHNCYTIDRNVQGRSHEELMRFPEHTSQRIFAEDIETIGRAHPRGVDYVIRQVYRRK